MTTAETAWDPALEPERYELLAADIETSEWTRRAFFRALGGGLVVLAVARESRGFQESGGRPRGGGPLPAGIDAWLHIAEDGTATGYTGKVEVGQNIRTSLTQAIAEELRIGVDSIRLVMGDTERVPFDMGTFGSRTTPTMAIQLRRAAAAAREQLITLASERWQIDRARLGASGGKVIDPETGKSLSFGELTRGQKLLKAIDEGIASTPPERWEVIGRSVPKVNGRDAVTGRHKFTSDMKRPGMLYGKVLRPSSFGATLTSVSVSRAEAMPGVIVVRDGDFVGVVAADVAAARRALGTIEAEWKETKQPADSELFTILKAPLEEGPRGSGRPSRDDAGSTDDALAAAPISLRAEYRVAYIAHAPLEPRAAVAEWEGDRLTVWTGTQRPFGVRSELARAFNISEERVRVIVPDTGSGYGGKHTGEAAIEAARLAKGAQRPVKLVWTREEEFTWAYFRPAGVIEVAGGTSKDGTLTAWEFHNYNSGGAGIGIPYEVPNRRIAFHSSQSPLRQGSYRALASTANHFARESHLDDLARAAGLDALAFRLKNLKDDRLRAVFEAAAEGFGWRTAKNAPGRGIGIAGGTEKGGYVATCAEVEVDRPSGRVRVIRLVTAFECGGIVNPDHLKNQVEGALVMGLGGALFEAVKFAEGKVLNARFSRYRVPRFGDIPTIDVVLLDRKDLPSAGAGEAPIIGVAPAIGNAICDATGIRLRSLPLVPDGLKA